MERNGIQQTDPGRVDKGSLNGLRGLFAFHVMAYHALLTLGGGTWPKIDLYAIIDMPLFFLLSGFSLTLAYGKTNWDRSSLTYTNDTKKDSGATDIEKFEKPPNIFNAREFYKKRLIRIFPLHYLGTILVLIVWNFGYFLVSYFSVVLFKYDNIL